MSHITTLKNEIFEATVSNHAKINCMPLKYTQAENFAYLFAYLLLSEAIHIFTMWCAVATNA